ncbi:MAG: dihydrodipicolinate synthase family protein [Saprospiraceae bacterium]|nr:dihydrodipicolinate synthase family protein [Saprospiraceae bacterium]
MNKLENKIKRKLMRGTVIPAHPLALKENRKIDEKRQRALTRYYLDAGAGGLAVGVHTTQFAIRDPKIELLKRVLTLAAEEVKASGKTNIIQIAGVCGKTKQALKEAELASQLGYDLALLSNNGLQDLSEKELILRAQEISQVMPVFGFYLQPAVGGKILSRNFWEKFSEIENVHAIKIAPFNRYQTFDVVQAVCNSSRNETIALYTGNDDNIFLDLITTYEINTINGPVKKEIVGGLLGHWSVWTQKAVELLRLAKKIKEKKVPLDLEILTLAQQITDSNAAFFDAQNQFKGCIAGLHEVLRRQGIFKGTWCLDPEEALSAGQADEITRVYEAYPQLHDDKFVKKHLKKWLVK